MKITQLKAIVAVMLVSVAMPLVISGCASKDNATDSADSSSAQAVKEKPAGGEQSEKLKRFVPPPK